MMPSDPRNREKGIDGENRAEDFFARMGYQTVVRNYRASRFAEIDLIVKKDKTLVFVEVKNRSSEVYGGVLYSITKKKKMNMKKAAEHFLAATHPDYVSYVCRFDLFGLESGKTVWVSDIVRY